MSYHIGFMLMPLMLLSCVNDNNTIVYDDPLTLKSTAQSSLCQKTEIAVVSCQLDEPERRLLALCHSTDTQKVHYRLGHQGQIDSTQMFTEQKPLLRWVDSSAYTTYFGFKKSNQYYSIGVPQETHGAKVFVDIIDKHGQESSSISCVNNSFEHKMLASPAIMDLSDDEVYKQGINFPYDYYTNQ